ncbi:uncharacterized protein [Dysidea avara]|uniref:uncharacterized protein isoform X2 n=1 Tax=Dysidea avara TaxID=196820 RepID=UPI0033218B51
MILLLYLLKSETNCLFFANPCAKLDRPANGNITCTGEQVTGESCTFTCQPGYSLQGSQAQTCLPNGTWSGTDVSCPPMECDELVPPNDAVIILPCFHTFLSSCTIQCNEGYFLPIESSPRQQCVLGGNGTVEWSPPPICLPVVACDPNPCLHGGQCIAITPVVSLCNCEGTGYTGQQCQFGVIEVPPFPLLQVGQPPFILNITAKPDDDIQVGLVQDNISAVTFSPNPATIENPNVYASISITPLLPGLYRVAYLVLGTNRFDFDIPLDSYLAIGPEVPPPAYSYFIERGTMIGRILPSCCSPPSSIFTTCPTGDSVSILSSCFINNITGTLVTEGILFSTGNGLHLPLAIAGARVRFLGNNIIVDQLTSNERSNALDCSTCDSLAGNLGDVRELQPSQCYSFAPSVSDIKDFLSSEALAFTYLLESRSLVPEWLDIVAVEYPARGFGLNAYQVDLRQPAAINNIETCSNIPAVTSGLHSLLHYSGLLDVTISNVFSDTFTPTTSNSPLCFAVNLCDGAVSAFHIGLPQAARQFLSSKLNMMGLNFNLAGVSLSRHRPLSLFPPEIVVFNQQYWNGRNYFTPEVPDIDIALAGRFNFPSSIGDLSVDLDFSGIVGFSINNFDELTSIGLQQNWYGIFSGGYMLDIRSTVYGETINVSLIPTSTYGVISFGGNQTTPVCNDDATPAGISLKVTFTPQPGSKDFFTQLLYVPLVDFCDLDGFLFLTQDFRPNGFAVNFQCLGIRLGTFVFHDLEHTIYFSGNDNFEELCAEVPQFDIASTSVLVQSRFVSNEFIPLGSLLLLQPTSGSLALTATFSRNSSEFVAQLYSVNITLFDATINTVVNINQDQLFFTADNVPLFNVFPIDYIGSVQQGKMFDDFPLQLFGTFVHTGSSFPAILEQTVHNYLITVANDSITRVQNAENSVERASEQVRNIETLLQVREEDFQTANRLHNQAILNIAIANGTVLEIFERLADANQQIQQLRDAVENICRLQVCPSECISGLQCKTCYTDVYSTILGRCPDVCYDQRLVRVPPFSEESTCWVRKQVRIRVRRCVCHRYFCTYQVFFTFVLRNVPEKCHKPVFNHEIKKEPRFCEKPCPVRTLTDRIAQQCCETHPCADQVPSPTCLMENAACRVARQRALDTLRSAEQNLSEPLRELTNAQMRLAISISEEIRLRVRVEVTREAVRQTQAVLESTRAALNLTIAQQMELVDKIKDGAVLYQLLRNTTIENLFTVDSVSFEITIVDKTPFIIPLKIRFSIPGIMESFETTVVFDFTNIGLHLQRTSEVLAGMAFGDIGGGSRSKRQTVIMEDPESTTALVNQRCTDLLNTHDYIEELQDTLETIVEQIISSKLNATEARLQIYEISTIDEEVFRSVNFSVLQTQFNLPAQSSLFNTLKEGNESKALTEMIMSFGMLDEDLANANENSVFLDWQATIEMLHNQTGSSGGYFCFGFADCLTTAVSITRELLQLSPIPESRQLLEQLPAAADDLLQLALSSNLSIFSALQKTDKFRSILNATREINYWCAQPPNITVHPVSNISLGQNSTLHLTCQATSEFRIDYQWRHNGAFVPGAVNAVLSIVNVQTRHSGNYSCDARNHVGVSESANSSVIIRTLPSIYLQPGDTTSYAGNENGVVFACNASGTPTPGYRWYFRSTTTNQLTKLEGADSNEYTVFSPQSTNEGMYYCEAFNEEGSTISRGAVLTVLHTSVSQLAVTVSLGVQISNGNTGRLLNALQDSIAFGEVEIQQFTAEGTDQNHTTTVSFSLVTRNTTSRDTISLSLEELASRTVQSRSDLLSVEEQLTNLVANESQITNGVFSAVLSSVAIEQSAILCPQGQALDTTNNLLCVNCPPGHFQTDGEQVTLIDGENVTEVIPVCAACSANQHQPDQGQTSCLPCPAENFVSGQCLIQCSPGTFSSTGHQPCTECTSGTYQPNSGARECLECNNDIPEPYCSTESDESSFVMGITPVAAGVSSFVIFTILVAICAIYCVRRKGKKRKYRMQQKLARPGGNSQLSLIGINRVNSNKKVVPSSDVYVCMPQNDNADGFSLTEDNTPMFEKFMLPDTPPPPPPRSDLPELPSRSPPVRSKPPPIPPRPSESGSPSVCQPKPPKPLPRYKRDIQEQNLAETRTKPPVMPRIIRRLSQRYSQRHRQSSKIPSESYETFLANEDL